jgi:hypothetical protein
LKPIDESFGVREDLLKMAYETGAPLMPRALSLLQGRNVQAAQASQEGASIFDESAEEQMLELKKKLVSKQFSTYTTRTVGEISKAMMEPLELMKSVITVLDVDADVQRKFTC